MWAGLRPSANCRELRTQGTKLELNLSAQGSRHECRRYALSLGEQFGVCEGRAEWKMTSVVNITTGD
jgi:hypothetical protein